ncbi:UNVERIFIED_CONTAM: protein EARLY-RESPONSIVE TO DEHYDRATION 7, chloroplastic [Sesamum latifolium]|uniref:Protein EARLY-RESPONSIVE TO DEHYDRATION 7, chloroplastic n=1 Tax=Sesamum latifolium TaxID=2727402 RepID=A0AAW2V178_9LAMI
MSSQSPKHRNSLYPEVDRTNPESTSLFISNPSKNPSSSSLYPSIEMKDLAEISSQKPRKKTKPAPRIGAEMLLLNHLRKVPSEGGEINGDSILNYGLTIAAKGQEGLLRELDTVLENFSAFRVEKAAAMVEQGWWGAVAKEVSPEEMERKKEEVEKSAAAYWTTLAPNVEDYSGSVARMIAAGSGQVVRGILWCGDVTVDRLKWGHDFLKNRVGKASSSDVSPQALRRMKRVKRLTKMSEQVATGILSGVVKVSGFFTGSVANSRVGQKFFSLLPGEIVLASLDGFNKVCDAVEVAGKNVMSTTSVVTTGLVSQRYGEQAGEVTHDGLGAAGHAIGTAWTVFKIRKALNPKSVLKPATLVKAAANSAKSKAK